MVHSSHRLLILACSATKRDGPKYMPAIDRYDGPLWQTLRTVDPAASIGCPFHDNARWRHMRDHDTEAWADAVEVDHALRTGLRGIRGQVYLHRSCTPLDQADLSMVADHGQLDLWPNECEGMCGV